MTQIVGGPFWLLFLLKFIEVSLLIMMTIFWVRAMARAIESCHPAARTTESWSAWLTLIPLFGLVWQFVSGKNAGESLAREYYRRGWKSEEGRPGYELGAITSSIVVFVFLLRSFDYFSDMLDIHPGFYFIGTVVIGFCMYRHMDRLNAYRERIDKEAMIIPDLAFTQYQQALRSVNVEKQTWNPIQQTYSTQPVAPAQNIYPAYQQPTFFQQEQQNNFPPSPLFTPAPAKEDDHSKWMPKKENEKNPNGDQP
ncbi:MAG: hypothetical protein HY064_13895 [Bacteroidetes bacterium]|nr:hypothetical protein [Bacteroidota bacterium]